RGARRCAVRDLHAGDGHRSRALSARGRGRVGRQRARGHRGKSLPLHRVREDRRCHPGRRRSTRMIPVTSARSLQEAYAILQQRDAGLRVLAGGTDLMVAIGARIGLERIGRVLDIWRVPELRGISVAGRTLRIGALTTYTELMRSPEIARELPALAAVSREVG